MSRFRLLRVLLTVTAFAVVWLVSARARAADASMMTSVASAFGVSTMDENASFAPPPSSAPEPIGAGGPATNLAPLCDPRGATTFAPPPQMQDAEVSLETNLTLDDCMPVSVGDARHAAPGRAPLPVDASASSSDVLVATTIVTLARASRERLPAPDARVESARPGVRSTVDRPPRFLVGA